MISNFSLKDRGRKGRVSNPQDRSLNRTMERRGGTRRRFRNVNGLSIGLGKQIRGPYPLEVDERNSVARSGRRVWA